MNRAVTDYWIDEGTGHGRAYQFRTPGGHLGEIFWNVERFVAPQQDASVFRNRAQRRSNVGSPARFLHHANLSTARLSEDVAFFTELLGFKFNEAIRIPIGVEIFAALACTNLDHDLGLTRDPEGLGGRLNHLAYYLESREQVLLAADAALEAGLEIELGPTKHGIGESFFLYVRDPGSQQRVEIYSGGYLNFEPDRPTVIWSIAERPHPMLAWGGEMPAAFGGGGMAEIMRSRAGQRGATQGESSSASSKPEGG